MGEFVENFKKAINVFEDCREDETVKEKTKEELKAELKAELEAEKVITAVKSYAENKMRAENVINLFFADHGWKHSERLSKYALFMMEHLKKECREELQKKEWDNMMVLLWTSLALHDIGMNDITKNDEELTELIVKQAGRIDHVGKSGEWISRIIDHIDEKKEMRDKTSIEPFVEAWNGYWSGEHQLDPTTALRIVKDIVLMHGESENWLAPEKMGSLDRDVFEDIDENLGHTYKKVIKYSEAVLCLSDLLDICPERMNIFANEDLNKYFEQMDESKKRLTFEHWASHKIAHVSMERYEEDGLLILEMCRYSMDSKMYLNNVLYSRYSSLGTIKDCLRWGNDERLKKILVDFGYNGIGLRLSNQSIRTWKEIHEKAIEFHIFKRKQILDINSKLNGISNVFINEIMHDWIDRSWQVEEKIFNEYDFRNIFYLMKEGAALHLLFNKGKEDINKKSKGFYIKLLGDGKVAYDINDFILSAMNAVFEISNSPESIRKIAVITKGSATYSTLLYGGNSDSETAYIVIVENSYEDDFNKIIRTLSQKKDHSFVIFVPVSSKGVPDIGKICQKIEYSLDENRYESIMASLNEYAIKHWAGKEKANSKEKTQVKELCKEKQIGIGEFLRQLKFIYNGIQATEEKIAAELERDKYSSFFILNLFEMMSEEKCEKSEEEEEDKNPKNREIERDKLEYFYCEFRSQNRSEIYKMEDFDTAIKTLLSLCEETDGKIILLQDKVDSFKKLIIHSSREMPCEINRDLFQMMIFFWLYNCRKVNFKSLCYRAYLTYLSPEQLCNYIFNKNIVLEERINISFETSEIIVGELKNSDDNDKIKIFMERYISSLLDSRNALTNDEDMISFQAIYRIFRGILAPDMEDVIDYTLDIIMKKKSLVGYLGYIEAICSAKIPKKEKINKKLNAHLENMLEEIFRSSASNIQYMAYDVLYNYKKKELQKKYFNSSWENICASLHNNAELEEGYDENVYKKWDRMRQKFINILDKTSPSIRKRNKIENVEEEEK